MTQTPAQPSPQPPVARKVPSVRTHHGDAFEDNYEWLRDKESAEVVDLLKAENAYQEAVTAHQEPLREAIFQEIKGRTQETDLSVPNRKDGWWYYTRSVEGKEYGIHCRVRGQDTGDRVADWTPPAVEAGVDIPGEEVLLDGNLEAEGKPFFAVGGAATTIDGTLYAYAVDNAGDERFTLRIKDLRTGELAAGCDRERLLRHLLLPRRQPDLLYRGGRFLAAVPGEVPRARHTRRRGRRSSTRRTTSPCGSASSSPPTGATWCSASAAPSSARPACCALMTLDAGLRTVISRDERILYEAEPFLLADASGRGRERILLTHNKDAINSMVSLVDPAELAKPLAEQHWDHRRRPFRPGPRQRRRRHLDATLVVSVRKDTIERVQVLPLAGLGTPEQGAAGGARLRRGALHRRRRGLRLRGARDPDGLHLLLHPVPGLRLCAAHPGAARPANCCCARKARCWAATPPSDYVATREWAVAADGTRIPLSVLRHASVRQDSTAAGLVYGYGSYEMSMDPGFGIPRLSLLDRGIVFVIAHIRGGGELGRHWYDDGKKLHKKNTFTDFIAATDWLAGSGWVDPARIAAMGGSAGGLLMGAVANLAPEKYAAIVAAVPFVDALTTILDPELPLSALEWEEWGNPITDPDVYAYMKSYTPYENVRAVAYPKIAAVTSFNDTRVLYVEPAKWVQRLREVNTGSEPIVLKIEMEGGHGGASGRYVQWRERAWDYAFVADSLGATELLPGAGLK